MLDDSKGGGQNVSGYTIGTDSTASDFHLLPN